MGIAPKIIKCIGVLLKSDALPATSPIRRETRTLLSFVPKDNIATSNKLGVMQYRIKPDITIPIRPETLYWDNPAFPISGKMLQDNNSLQLWELGNISFRLGKKYKALEQTAKEELNAVFDGFEVSVRAKGANSVYSKLKRVLQKQNKTIKTDEEARQIIQDAIGGRIQLKDITRQDLIETLNTLKINGKTLTASEKNIIQRYFNNEKLSAAELEIAQNLSKPVKLALAEKQSDPVVRKFMLSGLKDALNRNVTTMEKLEKAGIRKDILEELKSNPNITPLKLGEINNYKGKNGIAYFSDRQIREFEKMQLATGEKFDIITCSEDIDLTKYGLEKMPQSAQDAIKPSGYTTGQINVTLSDGTLAEVQIRGSGDFAEYEHIAYDAKLNKNTLGEIYKEYKDIILKIPKEDMPEYNKYISDCYDYYRDIELGIIREKPQLPEKFNKILSEENMKRLHELDEADQKNKMKTFVPHIEDSGQEYVI